MKTQLSNRPFAPEVVTEPTPEPRVLHYRKGRSIKHKTPKVEWSEDRWTTFVQAKGRVMELDTDVKMEAVQRRAQATERQLVYVRS
jgi:hypothetical protein